MEGLHQLFDEQEVAVEDTYSGYQSSKLPGFQQLDQHSADEADLFLSASARNIDTSMFHQPQQLSHLSSSYSEDDLAQAADVVTADLDAVLMAGNSTPPPALQPSAHMVAHQPMQHVYVKQEHSGAAGSSCGACSPQASCDTHSKAQHFWAAQQYDAAYNLVLAHSPVSQYAPAPMHGAYGSSAGMGMAGAPCAGPCCYPGSSSLLPQGSGSMPVTAMGPAPPQFDYPFASQGGMGYAGMLPGPAGGFGSAGPAAAAGMVPHAAFGSNNMVHNNSAPSAVGPSLPQHSMQPQGASLQRAYSSYPAVQGGVQKRQSGSGSGSAAALDVLRAAGKKTSATATAEVRAARKSADGSCSSKDGSAAPPPRPKKASKASTSAAAAAAGAGSAGRTSRGSASAAAAPAAPVGATGSAAALIKELQQEIESLTASKAKLKSQVRTLLTSQTDLLSRVATLTTKWQQAVAENAALHRQNLQLASQGL